MITTGEARRSITDSITSPGARSTTIRLLPR